MGGRPVPERSAGPQGGADLRHLARRGDTRGRGTVTAPCSHRRRQFSGGCGQLWTGFTCCRMLKRGLHQT
jgi:hypothetical protein